MTHRINTDLIRRVRAQIEADPTRWNQGDWVETITHFPESGYEVCETAYCFAGWTLALSGWEITEGNEYVPLSFIRSLTGLTDTQICIAAGIQVPRTPLTNPEIHVGDAALVILGLEGHHVPEYSYSNSQVTARALFAGSNTLEAVDHYIAAILAIAEETV